MTRLLALIGLLLPVGLSAQAAGVFAARPDVANGQSAQTAERKPALFAANINNVLFADQFAGADTSVKIQNAIQALPANGGTVDARNLNDFGGVGSTVIDPGSRAVTLLLGPSKTMSANHLS
jgi:hypothetical protein